MNDVSMNFIAGEWVAGDGVSRDINPSNTKDLVGEYARASAAQVETAVAAARAAFPAWSRSTPQERHDILLRGSSEILARREELGRLLAREEGKSLRRRDRRSDASGTDIRFLRRARRLRHSRREAGERAGPMSMSS